MSLGVIYEVPWQVIISQLQELWTLAKPQPVMPYAAIGEKALALANMLASMEGVPWLSDFGHELGEYCFDLNYKPRRQLTEAQRRERERNKAEAVLGMRKTIRQFMIKMLRRKSTVDVPALSEVFIEGLRFEVLARTSDTERARAVMNEIQQVTRAVVRRLGYLSPKLLELAKTVTTLLDFVRDRHEPFGRYQPTKRRIIMYVARISRGRRRSLAQQYEETWLHELGHHLYYSFPRAAIAAWNSTVRRDYRAHTYSIEEICAALRVVERAGDTAAVREQVNPDLARAAMALLHGRMQGIPRHRRGESIARFCARVRQMVADGRAPPLVHMPGHYITDYALDSPVEAFAEALELALLEGPAALPITVRRWLHRYFPGWSTTPRW